MKAPISDEIIVTLVVVHAPLVAAGFCWLLRTLLVSSYSMKELPILLLELDSVVFNALLGPRDDSCSSRALVATAELLVCLRESTFGPISTSF